MIIEPASDMDEVRAIFREYAASLGVDLSFQDFEHELEALPDYYVVIVMAREDGQLAGCVALRHLDDDVCEMKRLYVRPAFRGRDLGRTLANHVIEEARKRGYKTMRLDTLPSMRTAMSLYESLGFRDVDAYRFNPIEGSRFLELTLVSS